MNIITIIAALIGFVVGGGIVWLLLNTALKSRSKKIIREAEAEAEVIKKDKILQAKEKFLAMKAENEKEINQRNQKMAVAENRIRQKEQSVDQKSNELQRRSKELDIAREKLDKQVETIDRRKEDIEKLHKQSIEKLESITGMSSAQAKEQLIESLKAEARTEAMSYVNDIMDEAKINANKEAKKIIIQSIQR
ncbi:MAG: Rnase Y domain-containing protein, partial [Bacteroidales bacterium]|nr:Rnase Y domain-containing protein [Bacteroidales bacterium]